MQSALPSHCTARNSLLLAAALTAGCATTLSPPPSTSSHTAQSVPPPPADVQVVRYGRYTLVELAPTEAQRNLMLQVVDVAVPETLHATVGDALRHVLQRSGYQLCSGPQTDALNALPLPAAHYQLGPIVLRDALLTLAGPAWDLHADDGARRVCFSQLITPVDPVTPLPAPVQDAETSAEAFPLVEEAQP
ncbi:PFGI-1 class ICE element type IV pilus protein PilL2 [Denitromonas ohlonensis]|uniref:Integrating conjugative element protein pill, pfgi-1 n=2 Tax=Denitromonas TaxID=139331 RepID=A0A558EXA2_9RHOO|nr:PilL N-terminal domain-containing protein [Denitromonas ohlonensis]TVT47598.1 MAG: hypothetical protein FHP94_13595 [Denitromonas halophila]TVO63301.1 hypothetical protein FHP90_14825 [Denitromonas ohlonensis]TVO76152.1 hypothetical protein FHP89_11920 [Denitromonas ohlonensis]TVT70031.1 MAG: hypothetical protein FHP93_12600 [Denitromonas halophila]TVT77539.1 MAG: hypothetical protein FHP92_05100 [Denitromonas halophila]